MEPQLGFPGPLSTCLSSPRRLAHMVLDQSPPAREGEPQLAHLLSFFFFFFKFTILTISNQFSSVKCIHPVVQSVSRTFSSSRTETLYPLHNNSPQLLSSPHPLAATILPSVSVNLAALGTPYKWNHTVFVFGVWLISLCITSSRFIHVVACIRISFLFKAE